MLFFPLRFSFSFLKSHSLYVITSGVPGHAELKTKKGGGGGREGNQKYTKTATTTTTYTQKKTEKKGKDAN